MSTELICEYNMLTTHVKVYGNRIEIQLGSGPFSKKEMIPFRNIASVEKPAILNCIDIKTNDGKNHRIALSPSDNQKLKNQILGLL
jgi:hypothetical protein